MNAICKSGSCSIVLGSDFYKDFLQEKKKLLKITLLNNNHNEFKYISIIKKIKKYKKYYAIPDEVKYLLKPTDLFYNKIKELINNNDIFCDKILYYFYVDYAGDKELFDTINELDTPGNNLKYWNSYKKILIFTKKIIKSIKYLHEQKICHLDIKPENIIVNTSTNKYKLIDFGFSDIEPFNNFIKNKKGTPGYFPKYFKNDTITDSLPKIEANDMIPVNGVIPMNKNNLLVYKIDSYCLGRVLYVLEYMYNINNINNLNKYCLYDKKHKIKLKKIINLLLENDVYKRITIIECYNNNFLNIL